MLNVFSLKKVGFVRALPAHGLRAAIRAGGDGRGGAGQSRLAGLEFFWADPRRDGLRAHLRHGVQSHRRSEIRRVESAHRQSSFARRTNFSVQRLAALPVERRRFDCGQPLLNPLCFYLSPVALAVICFYSLTKRFTDYTHVFLGLALALAPVGAWLAVKGANVSILEILQMTTLALAVVLWLVGFDIIYALQDYEFDKAHGLHSLVVAWGQKNALQAAFLAHLVMCGLLLVFGLLCRFRIAYLVGWMMIVGCLVLEHWIARRRSLNWINVAFFRLNAVVSAVFLIVTVAEVVFQGGFRLR